VTRHDGVVTSAEGEAAPRREKEEVTLVLADTNLIGLKNEENSCGRFSCYKWMVKI
jgi:hypothetical protein